MQVRIWAGLILCNTVWSLNPVAGKILLENFPPLQVVFFRYVSAFFSALAWITFLKFKNMSDSGLSQKQTGPNGVSILSQDRTFYFWLFILAFFPLILGPFLQASGLNLSRATDNTLIIAIEPLITLFLAALLLKQKMKMEQWLSLGIALVGFWFLSDLNKLFFSKDASDSIGAKIGLGNLLVLVSLIGEGLYSVAGTHLLKRMRPLPLFTLALFIAFLVYVGLAIQMTFFSYGGAHSHHPESIFSGGKKSWEWNLGALDWLAVLWLGPFGTTFTYIYWLVAMKSATVPQMAITLYFQPLLGALWGAYVLHESLGVLQWAGGLLILLGVTIPLFSSHFFKALKNWRSSRES